jgi:MFS family permease
MPIFHRLLFGPWRAVLVLGFTQIAAWGTIFYPPVLTVPLLTAERGWSIAFGMAGLSWGLGVAGLVSRTVGTLIDRYGGHRVMPFGSLLGAAGLVGLALVENPIGYFAVWTVLGMAMAASLYDPAFATLGRIFGAGARPPITALTLAGGLASTVSWPATHLLIDAVGWRGTYLIYAGVLALIVAPLHAFALPRSRTEVVATSGPSATPATTPVPPHGLVFILVATGFAAYAFTPSGLSAHLLAIFDRLGLDRGTAVAIGALFGPAQVLARLCEFMFARHVHPLIIARLAIGLLLAGFALLALLGLSVPVAAAFVVLFGMGNGLLTIARGSLPLALFGPAGFGRLIGRIAGPYLVMQAIAPLVLAFVIERASDAAALAVTAAFCLVALVCLALVRARR